MHSKSINLEEKEVTKEVISQAKVVCFYAPDMASPTSHAWQEAVAVVKGLHKLVSYN